VQEWEEGPGRAPLALVGGELQTCELVAREEERDRKKGGGVEITMAKKVKVVDRRIGCWTSFLLTSTVSFML